MVTSQQKIKFFKLDGAAIVMSNEERFGQAEAALAFLRSVLADIDLEPRHRVAINTGLRDLQRLSDEARNCRYNKAANEAQVERLNCIANGRPPSTVPPWAR